MVSQGGRHLRRLRPHDPHRAGVPHLTPGEAFRPPYRILNRILPNRPVFVYDIPVREDEISEAQIRAWVDEAEAGYDVEALRRRGRGRPGRGAEPMQVVAVRLSADEVAALDAIAARERVTRSEVIRRALAQFAA